MRDQELYDHAYTMLAETNVYPKSPEEILYQAPSGAKYSLPELIWSELFNRKKEIPSACCSRCSRRQGKREAIIENGIAL